MKRLKCQKRLIERLIDSPFALSLINVITATQRTTFCIISSAGGQPGIDLMEILRFPFFDVSLLFNTNTLNVLKNRTNVLIDISAKTLDDVFSFLISSLRILSQFVFPPLR